MSEHDETLERFDTVIEGLDADIKDLNVRRQGLHRELNAVDKLQAKDVRLRDQAAYARAIVKRQAKGEKVEKGELRFVELALLAIDEEGAD